MKKSKIAVIMEFIACVCLLFTPMCVAADFDHTKLPTELSDIFKFTSEIQILMP